MKNVSVFLKNHIFNPNSQERGCSREDLAAQSEQCVPSVSIGLEIIMIAEVVAKSK